MPRIRTVAVCYPQVPFVRGGTERLAEGLVGALRERGFDACLVSVPFRWTPGEALAHQCLTWRSLDLSESNGRPIDLVVTTKFPSYVVPHPQKVTWLVHQHRQAYDLWDTPYGDLGFTPEDQRVREMVRRVDDQTLPESRKLFAISRTVAERLRRFNGLEAIPLYPPPRHPEVFGPGEMGPYILAISRLEPLKRLRPLVEALAFTDSSLRCIIVGVGPEEDALRNLARCARVEDRLEIRPSASLKQMAELLTGCLAVYNAPYQEDYGLVTIEAFLSHKPVVTAPDAGGPLEFVEDGVTGAVVELQPEKLGERLQQLFRAPEHAAELGFAGYERVRSITWDAVVDALLPV